ncbi:MAG: PHP domain-containing protein [Candidatus Thorarchaeota archaeon]|nr:PHP domain-containing protein [Candidatus Thorarchaeota archaeon]
MMGRADLHTHSTISDGSDFPKDIVRMSSEAGLLGISLTDHDSLDGLEEFMIASAPNNLERIPGLEISTTYGTKEAHLLGYFVPKNNTQLSAKLKWFRDVRLARFPKMLRKLEDIGISMEKEELDLLLEGVKSPGRPHIGRILIDRGVVRDMDEAFNRYLNRGRPVYVDKEKLDIVDAISLLRAVGAVPVLAHPLTIDVPIIRDALFELKELGLMGVETVYDYSHFQIQDDPAEVIKASKEIGLIETGGTDYHGTGWRLPIGGISVSLDVVDELKVASRELGGDPDSWEVE